MPKLEMERGWDFNMLHIQALQKKAPYPSRDFLLSSLRKMTFSQGEG